MVGLTVTCGMTVTFLDAMLAAAAKVLPPPGEQFTPLISGDHSSVILLVLSCTVYPARW